MTNNRQPDGVPPGWQEVFLAQLRETRNVSAATQTGRRATDIAAMLRGDVCQEGE